MGGTLLVFVVSAFSGSGAGVAAARAAAAAKSAADAPVATAAPNRAGPTAPSGPPLTAGAGGTVDGGIGEETDVASPQGEEDPLVSNGLGSPLCKGVLGPGQLTVTARQHCETSGFVAAAAPTGYYGIDVHIDTGVLGLSSGGLLSTVQDLFVTPLWMALVWAVHALIVMLEWCFTIDLLDSAAAAGVGGGLREMQASFTEPWLALVLAVASMVALYDGLIRRRVAETVGQALLMGTMMIGGMWVIADPGGTVGALGRWANQASLGTLAVAARGSPADVGSVLAGSMDTVFAAAIEAPWCYLEFGDVSWCRNPALLNPRLHAAALKIAAEELATIGCRFGSDAFSPCVTRASTEARSLEHSAELLRDARSNGAVFLALPANGPARNSINDSGSLLRAICQTSEATNCRGPTAAQAEFRTNGGTWSRVGGLLLIVAGVLGMMLLLGFIALRLLAAAIFSLLYLLLAPAMVLAPALGDGGRAVFRRWAAHLLGAVVSKLLFSFLLGVVFAVLAILSSLEELGWWTQWLLMSAFWWGAYARRHHALGFTQDVLGRESSPQRSQTGRRALARRVNDALEPQRKAIGAARWGINKLAGAAPGVEQRQRRAEAGHERARAESDAQVARVLDHEHRDADARVQAAPEIQRRLAAKRARLTRLEKEHVAAQVGGNARRALELEHRRRRVHAELEREQAGLNAARRLASEGRHALGGSGRGQLPEQVRERERFLDEQAGLPAGAVVGARARAGGPSSRRRDYPALIGLAGLGREEYERLDPGARRAARLEVDRELAVRSELHETAKTVAGRATSMRLGRSEQARADREFDRTLQRRMRDRAQTMPASRRERSAIDHLRDGVRAERGAGGDRESSVMRDVREVAARRKRQLGRDRP